MKELSIPPEVKKDENAVELVRLWSANNKQVVTLNIGIWQSQELDEAHAWGVLLWAIL